MFLLFSIFFLLTIHHGSSVVVHLVYLYEHLLEGGLKEREVLNRFRIILHSDKHIKYLTQFHIRRLLAFEKYLMIMIQGFVAHYRDFVFPEKV